MAGGKKKREKKQKMREQFVASYDKLVTEDPQELITRIIDYTYDCNDTALPLTATGMAMALGLQRNSFLSFGDDGSDHKHDNEEVVAIVRTARMMIETQLEQRLQGRASNGAAFNLKSNFGWRDVTKLAVGSGENGDEPLVKPTSVDVAEFSTELLRELAKHRDASTAAT